MKTEIVCVIDRSGSMEPIKDDVIGGLNTFIKDHSELEGTVKFTIILFDHEYLVSYDGVNVEEIEPFDNDSYIPRGTTALLDAMGKGVNTIKDRLLNAHPNDMADKVIVAIMTDGYENSSQEYSKGMISKLIKEQRGKGWEFLFLSADESAIQEAIQNYGLAKNQTMSFTADAAGTKCAYSNMSHTVQAYVSGDKMVSK